METQKCQGCQRILCVQMFSLGKKRCDDCTKKRMRPKNICIAENCNIRSSYGKVDSNLAEYCNNHKPIGYVDVLHKTCIFEGCKTQPVYGKKDSRLAEYCNEHKPIGYVNVKDKTCIFEDCKTRPNFGKKGSHLAEYCCKHKPIGYVDVKNKTCIYEGCKTLPTYGKKDSRLAEYCNNHKPFGYVNVKSKTCIYEGCKTRPVYGKKKSRLAEYCSKHKLIGYVNVKDKTCIFEGCKTQPVYGKKDSRLAEYCNKHKPIDYVDVKSNRCNYEDCKIRPTFAFPSLKNTNQTSLNRPTHCTTHKQEGMVLIKKCLKNNCNNSALYGTTKPIHCEEHKNSNDIDLTEQKCKQCGRIERVDPDGLCWDYCVNTTIHNKLYKKHQTVKQNRVAELLKKTITTEMFCIDKVIDSSCNLSRPDFVYDLGSHIVIVEVDEKAGNKSSYHKEDCEKEHIRMFEIANCFEGRSLIFIRYNPDNYHVNNVLYKTPVNQREIMLLKWINKAFTHKDFPQDQTNKYVPIVLTVYLYYNEYNEGIADFKELLQEDLTKGLKPCVK